MDSFLTIALSYLTSAVATKLYLFNKSLLFILFAAELDDRVALLFRVFLNPKY